MYYMIESLSASGYQIHLHYFSYKQNRNAGALEKICASIHSYQRKSWLGSFWSLLPYIDARDGRIAVHLSRQAEQILRLDHFDAIYFVVMRRLYKLAK